MDLFPAIEPYDSGCLPVSDNNSVYWENVGNPAGLPIVYLHGGPGSGCGVGMRRYFDPSLFRAVLFDQRGCGRSTPRVDDPAIDISTNTTGNLIADIERLREHLGIDRWVVAGVSWGVSLGLAYAQTHPERVIGMALGAITSGRRKEVEWITREMRRIFPREWERFVEPVPEGERDGNLAAAYARLLAHPDAAVRENAALRWCEWEDTHISLAPDGRPRAGTGIPSFGWCSRAWSPTTCRRRRRPRWRTLPQPVRRRDHIVRCSGSRRLRRGRSRDGHRREPVSLTTPGTPPPTGRTTYPFLSVSTVADRWGL